MRKVIAMTAATMLLIWACNKAIEEPEPKLSCYTMPRQTTEDSMMDVLDSLNTSLYRRLSESEARLRSIKNNGVEARTATYPIYE